MKRAILFLLIVSFAFAASPTGSGPAAITSAMTDLCNTSKAFLSTLTMLCCLPVIPLLIVGAAAIKLYKGENKSVKLAGKIAFGAGIVFGALAFLAIVIYLLAPLIISSISGMPATC